MQSSELSAIVLRGGRSHPLRRVIIIAVVAGLCIGAWWFWRSRQDPSDSGPTYITQKLRIGDVALTITATGTLEPTNKVTIGSEISGTVDEVYVDMNDRVAKGQQLAKLDTTKLSQSTERSRATLLSAEASVKQAAATVKETEAALARFEELHELSGGRTPSRADMESAIATVARAAADLASAEARVSEASADVKSNESDLDKGILRSPVDGIVLSRSVEVGQTVAAQFQAPELFVIAEDLSRMDLLVEVAEADIGRVVAGQNATFIVDAWPKRTYSAEVRRVAFGSSNSATASTPAASSGLVTYSAELDVPNEDMTLRPGMTATADVAVAEATQVLLVPNSALRFKPSNLVVGDAAAPKKSFMESLGPPRWRGGSRQPKGEEEPKDRSDQIWVLRNGKPEAIDVTTGITDGLRTEVEGPEIEAGMEIIVSAQQSAP